MVKKKRQSDPGEGGDSTESEENVNKTVCPHIAKSIDLPKLRQVLKHNGFEKGCKKCVSNAEKLLQLEGDIDQTLWMCLRCGSQLCGRTKHKHALDHYQTPHSDSHNIAANTTTWDVYCYACCAELRPSQTKKLLDCIENLKKQSSEGNCKPPEQKSPLLTPMQPLVLSLNVKTVDKSSLVMQRVRGLTNLGNTCFFNSVLQCLVQTPYLLPVLQEMAEPGEKFTLPGGVMKYEIKTDDGEIEKKELDLPPITGELSEWGPLTRTLAETLAELQAPGKSDVFTPRKLLSSLVSKLPQFSGGDQHDAHELLRHLLEAVRSEDLRRYQAVILTSLGLSPKVDPSKVDGEIKQKVKFYGQQASDTMLRPEQVFRGFLVSTLECQDCVHRSERHEYFLDLSLPVAADRPMPPAARRKTNDADSCLQKGGDETPSKHQIKKERRAKEKRSKNKNKNGAGTSSNKFSDATEGDAVTQNTDDKSSSEQSDADVEDNGEDTATSLANEFASIWGTYGPQNSNQVRTSPINIQPTNSSPIHMEKSDETPENPHKDDFYNSSTVAIPLAYKPIMPHPASNPDSGVASPAATQHNSTENVDRTESPGESQELAVQTTFVDADSSSPKYGDSSPLGNEDERPESRIRYDGEPTNEVVARGISAEGSEFVKNGAMNNYENMNNDDGLKMNRRIPPIPLAYPAPETSYGPSSPRKDYSYNYKPTISPRYMPEEGECSVQSCLNQFTALELMTGNNKVGCEACTERINGKNGKTVYTNATKRFLVSRPPSVLILHLKRFQLGPRCTFRKISKHVDFQTLLDLAPFCRGKTWASPGQTELYYSLYGVVEHSGGMHGGHYVAYVKVRPPVPSGHERWNFIAKGGNVAPPENGEVNSDSDTSISGYESGSSPATPTPPQGKWYYISDSRVSEITEDKVLRAQAYLLFYERIQ